MSRTRKTGGNGSPIRKYVRYSGGTGLFSYYDKEKSENVELENLDVIILDVRSSITGFNEKNKSTITSNIILDTKKEKLKVVAFAGKKPSDVAEGLYADIKSQVAAVGGKFTANILCLADFGKGWEITNIQFSGVALNSWIDFTSEHDNGSYYDYKVTFKKGVLSKRDEGKNVAVTEKEQSDLMAKLKKNPMANKPVWFYTVGFDVEDLTEEEISLAEEQDKKLQEYFEGVSSAPTKEVPENVTGAPQPSNDDDDEDDSLELPF